MQYKEYKVIRISEGIIGSIFGSANSFRGRIRAPGETGTGGNIIIIK